MDQLKVVLSDRTILSAFSSHIPVEVNHLTAGFKVWLGCAAKHLSHQGDREKLNDPAGPLRHR